MRKRRRIGERRLHFRSGNGIKIVTLKWHMTIRADNPSGCWLVSAFWVVAFSLFAAQCASVLKGALTCEGVQVLSDQLTVTEAEEYCRYAVRERKKVEGFWGTTWSEPIRINVSSSYRISRALVPGHFGNRGSMEMPLRRMRDNTGALLHEIVHIYAPNITVSLPRGWRSTFTRS